MSVIRVKSLSDLVRGYKQCPLCGCPMLKKGQKRKWRDDYRHAGNCPRNRWKP